MATTTVQKHIEKFIKLWYIEASTYNFSINLSLGLANAFMIKLLGYGLSELGLLIAIRVLAVAISQLPATIIVLSLRNKRKQIWLYAGAVNRISWAFVPLALLIPRSLNLIYLATLSFVAQFAGGVASTAAMDTVGDNVPSSTATDVFGKVNMFSYISILLSQLLGVIVFTLPLRPLLGYLITYAIALVSAIVSTISLYRIPDQVVTENSTGYTMIYLHYFQDMVKDSKLRRYLLVISLFNFAVSIPAPFWDYIVLSVTGGKEVFIPIKNIVNLGVKAFAIDFWQRLARRYGLKRTVVEGMAFTILVPVLYAEASRGIDLVIAEVISGFIWAPVDVGTSIYSVYLPPSTMRPIYLSTVNLLTNGVSTIATTVGTVIATLTGNVHVTLMTSAALRALTATVACKILPEVNVENDRQGKLKYS